RSGEPTVELSVSQHPAPILAHPGSEPPRARVLPLSRQWIDELAPSFQVPFSLFFEFGRTRIWFRNLDSDSRRTVETSSRTPGSGSEPAIPPSFGWSAKPSRPSAHAACSRIMGDASERPFATASPSPESPEFPAPLTTF